MATNLQQALSKVQAPKVSLTELRGKTFQAQAQNAPRIEQTNLGQQIPAMLKQGGEIYGQHVDESWKLAKQWYDEAKLADKDPLIYAAQKSGEESKTLFSRAKTLIQEGLDIDPLMYTRAYTGEKYAEQQAFQSDAMIQEQIKGGDFPTVGAMLEARQKLRKGIPSDVAKAVGLKSTNAFILKGAVRNDQQSEQALRMQQTASEDQNLRNTLKQIKIENFNQMLKQGVQDPKVFAKLLDDGLTDGSLNINEHYQMFGQFANSLADTGNTAILNGFFNQPIKLGNGETKKFGDVLPVEVRDSLFLKADESYHLNNKEAYDKYSRAMGQVAVDLENGNISAAMAGVDALDATLNRVQGSGRVTSQMKAVMTLRNQVMVRAARINNVKKASNDKAFKNLHEQSQYDEAITTKLAGGIMTTDWTALGVTDDNAREVITKRMDIINSNPKLSPQEKVSQMAHLASVLPDRSLVSKAYSEYAKAGLDGATNAMAQAMYSKNGEIPEMPAATKGLIEQYKYDPALFQKVADPETFKQTAILANTVDALGWDTTVRSKSQPLVMDKDTQANFDAYIQEAGESRRFTTPQLDNIKAHAKEYIRVDPDYKADPQASMEKAIKKAVANSDSMDVEFNNGGSILPRSVLIPNGQRDAVPLVQAQLDRKLASHIETNKDDLLYLTSDAQGRIGIMSSYTGKPLSVTTSEALLEEATEYEHKRQEESKAAKKAEIEKQRLEAAEANKRKGARPIRPSGMPYELY